MNTIQNQGVEMVENNHIPARDSAFQFLGSETAQGALFLAMALAKAEFPPIPKSATGLVFNKNGQSRPFKYSSLDDLHKATNPALGKHGLALLVVPTTCGDDTVLTVILGHKDGGQIRARLSFRNPKTSSSAPQADTKAWGCEMTYHRRYVEKAVLGVEGDDDADQEPIDERQQKPERALPPQRQPRQRQSKAADPVVATQPKPEAAPAVQPEAAPAVQPEVTQQPAPRDDVADTERPPPTTDLGEQAIKVGAGAQEPATLAQKKTLQTLCKQFIRDQGGFSTFVGQVLEINPEIVTREMVAKDLSVWQFSKLIDQAQHVVAEQMGDKWNDFWATVKAQASQ